MSDLMNYTAHLSNGTASSIVADSVSTSEGNLVFYSEAGDPIRVYRANEHCGFTTPDDEPNG